LTVPRKITDSLSKARSRDISLLAVACATVEITTYDDNNDEVFYYKILQRGVFSICKYVERIDPDLG
jgi:hypothetical protein